MKKDHFSRVDTQVSILTAIIVIISSALVFALNYSFSYHDMIEGLRDRVFSIHSYLENKLDKDSFHALDSLGDESTEQYQDTKRLLEDVKNATGVRYLYTAKMAEDGTFIYLVDGLPVDSVDFRHVGDPIEEEIIPDMQRALNGEEIMPNVIKSTSWGYIFISYLPIHEAGRVIGVLGIEFDAAHQYHTYQLLLILSPLVILLFCILSAAIAVFMFKRISNPTYKVLASTDLLTGLKNRNAFDTDVNNWNHLGDRASVGFLSMDLDGLKDINDTLGHAAGDEYIVEGCRVMQSVIRATDILYRTGGDEFVAVFRNAAALSIDSVLDRMNAELEKHSVQGRPVSISAGYALFDPEKDGDLFETLKRSDRAMYEQKRTKKQSRKGAGNGPPGAV